MVNFKSFFILIALVFAFSSCSSDDDGGDNQQNNGGGGENNSSGKTIIPSGIAFVHADGSALAANECINSTTNYALLISSTSTGEGSFKPREVKYTLNGTQYVTTFSTDGNHQLTGITLVDGTNRVEIVGTNFAAEVHFAAPDTSFTLVP